MTHIAILGECMIELNGKPFGEMVQTFGGDTLNAAVYLCRAAQTQCGAGIKTSFVTAMGCDPLSDGMIARWQAEGVSTDMVLRDPGRTPGLYLIQLDDAGERTFLYWRNQSAARYLLQHPDFGRIQDGLHKVDALMLSGISLAILPEADRAALLQLLASLQKAGVEIAFDSNFRPALWPREDGLKTVKDCYAAVYAATDLALVTFDDEQLIWGDKTPEETLARLQGQGVRRAVVKLGVDGCLVQDFTASKGAKAVPTQPVQTVVDTTSAGDSFNGGFLSAHLAGASMEEAAARGNALAGIVIAHRGAIIPRAATDVLV